MPTVRFTDNIQRHVNCQTRVVRGDSWQAASSNLPPIHSVRLVKGA